MLAPNRIAPFLETQDTSPRPRTEAQQKASRRNGAKSRGPRTAAGKARSSMNALRHGLLARSIAPPGDARMQDRLYLRIRRQLGAEFGPVTFTRSITLDLMAADYVQLTRVRMVIERAAAPPQPTSGFAARAVERTRGAAADRARYALLERLEAQCRFGMKFDCAEKQARKLAADVAAMPDCARQAIAEAEAEALAWEAEGPEGDKSAPPATAGPENTPGVRPPAEPAPIDPHEDFEAGELRRDRELLAAVAPMEDELRDRARTVSLLTDERRLTDAERPRWCVILANLLHGAKLRLGDLEEAERHCKNAIDGHLLAMAANPGGLATLSRYGRQLENAIARRIASLRRA